MSRRILNSLGVSEDIMARKKTPTLTEAELRLMTILWDLGEGTVSEVVAGLTGEIRLAYNTVLTTMRILEQKGYVRHVKHGRAHVYCPTVSRNQARRKAVRHMVRSLFNDSPELLLLSILEGEKLSSEDTERLMKMIEKQE